jgi:hypothetical protein
VVSSVLLGSNLLIPKTSGSHLVVIATIALGQFLLGAAIIAQTD